MKIWAGLVVALLLCGCVYDGPLVEDAVVPVDPALTGLWQEIPKEGEAEDPDEKLLILPFSKTEYVAVVSPGDGGLYFRAYPVHLEGMELIQLEWLGVDKDEDEPYHVCRYSLKDGVLTVEMLNDDVISSDLKDAAALREALLANLRNPDLFQSQGCYRRLND
ncbi:MAG: hypothetical protein ISR84_06265 [Kiritimatiellales bacterium]|nr:hypothetical protein [Kiritimatiellales bacterium]